MAVISALESSIYSTPDRPITVWSDSQYVIEGVTKGWAKGWRSKGWKNSSGKPALNPDLWGQLLDLIDHYSHLSFRWVRGHNGNSLNERADCLAKGAARGDSLIDDKGYIGEGPFEPVL